MIHVRKQLQVVDGVRTLVEPKSRHSRRTISLTTPELAALKTHRRQQIATFLERGVAWTAEAFVFCQATGAPWSDDVVRLHWYGVRRRAGLPDTVRFHDLRHAALTILATRGTLPQTLKRIAGHANIATTMEIYTHLDLDSVRTSVDLMADLYGAENEGS